MSLNWNSIGSAVSSALTAAGASGTTVTSALGALFKASNPDESDEMAIASQILVAANDPALVSVLAPKLASEVGIPADAAALAMTLGQPGVNVVQTVLEIEQLIKAGG